MKSVKIYQWLWGVLVLHASFLLKLSCNRRDTYFSELQCSAPVENPTCVVKMYSGVEEVLLIAWRTFYKQADIPPPLPSYTHNFRLLLRHFFFGHQLMLFLRPLGEVHVSQELLDELGTVQVVLRFPCVVCTVIIIIIYFKKIKQGVNTQTQNKLTPVPAALTQWSLSTWGSTPLSHWRSCGGWSFPPQTPGPLQSPRSSSAWRSASFSS